MDGFLLLDKPEGITSFALVKELRRTLAVKKIGHCGTLDPLATGLMIICLGKATKLARFVTAEKKSYRAELVLGAESTTFDREGELTMIEPEVTVAEAQVQSCLRRFRGRISQKPPVYSALKHQGRPLYKYARAGQAVEPEPREVVIERLELVWLAWPRLCLELTCSKGTYVRSLAHDLGRCLGCGAYVDVLRRTAIGDTGVEQAVTLETLQAEAAAGRATQLLVAMGKLLSLPSVYLKAEAAGRVTHGAEVRGADIDRIDLPLEPSQVVALRDDTGMLLAVGKSRFRSSELPLRQQARALDYVRVI